MHAAQSQELLTPTHIATVEEFMIMNLLTKEAKVETVFVECYQNVYL